MPKLTELFEKSKRKKTEDELQRVTRQLELATAALERARRTKPVKVRVKTPRVRMKGDTVRMILNDLHGAKANRAAVAAAIADAKALQPDHVILNGDMVDCGGFLAQHHVMGYVAETSYSYEDDIAYCNGFLDALREALPNARIEYIEGNHERRVETWCVTETLRHTKDGDFLRRCFGPEALLRLKEREIPFYRTSEFYDGLPVPGVIKRGKCFFLHGFTCAKAAAAATQSSIAGNVVFAHTHRAQSDVVRRVGTGVVGSWNPGCLCERQPLWQHGKPTDWTEGYAVQLVSRDATFLHLNIPIIDGKSHLIPLMNK